MIPSLKLTMMASLWLAAFSLHAQSTWSGAVSTSWKNSANWVGNNFPGTMNDVTIPNTTNKPVLDTTITIRSLTLSNSNSELTIGSGFVLTIEDATSDAITNSGTITNQGTIHIVNPNGNGINTTRVFVNDLNSTLTVNGTNGRGIYVRTGNGDFTNSGTINIGNNDPITSHGIQNQGATFLNEAGTITIGQTSLTGVFINGGGNFTNEATLNLGTAGLGEIGTTGIINQATFDNNGGTININNTISSGIESSAGTFTNSGNLNLGTSIAIGNIGINTNSVFTNEGTGIITLADIGNHGIQNGSGTFTNQGTISMGTTGSIDQVGINNTSGFTNDGGTINISNTNSNGISNQNINANFLNQGAIHIGANGSVATGLLNTGSGATFTNDVGASIAIDNTTSIGLNNTSLATFTNRDQINIGSNAAIGSIGLGNGASFTNESGTITIDRALTQGINNAGSGTFNNASTIQIGTMATISNVGLLNLGIFNNQVNSTLEIDNCIRSGIENNPPSASFTNQGSMTLGEVGGLGIYGILNGDAFSNLNGTIFIDNTDNHGLVHTLGTATNTFNNTGTISIGLNGTITGNGIYVADVFHNNGGTINLDNQNQNGIFINTSSFSNLSGGNINIYNTNSDGIQGAASTNFDNQATVTFFGDISGNAINGPFNNQSTGTIKGDGTISTTNFTHSGTLSPGQSPGILILNGNYSFAAASTQIVEIEGTAGAGLAGGHDQIQVNGTATLNNSNLSLLISGVYAPNDEFTILTSNTPLGMGNEFNVTLPLNWSISYDYPNPGDVTLIFGASLPVELLSFGVQDLGEAIQLQWFTASEQNNLGFDIQRAFTSLETPDAPILWQTIGFVAGAGYSLEMQAYHFLDLDRRPGQYYYRLQQWDQDGSSHFSDIKSVRINHSDLTEAISVYPNPVSETLYFKSNNPSNTSPDVLEICLTEPSGQILFQRNQKAQEPGSIPMQTLAPGVYFLTIKNGNHTSVSQILKL